jgi:pilus assembly protein CpaF
VSTGLAEETVAVDRALVGRLVSAAADRVDAEAVRRDALAEAPLTATARELLAAHVLREELQALNRQRIAAGAVPFGSTEADRYVAAVMSEMWYQGDAMERWKADPAWDELDMNGAGAVFAWYPDRGKVRVEPVFRSDEEMRDWGQRVARQGDEVGEHRWDADAYKLVMDLGEGTRLTALWGGRGTRGVGPHPIMCLRRQRCRDLHLEDYRRQGAISPQVADLVVAAVEGKLNVCVVGPTFAGKTTFCRAAIHESDPDERWFCIEGIRELQLPETGHSDVAEVLSREPNAQGEGQVQLAQLVQDSLTMNPQRIVLGEILNATDMTALLNAMSQGNDGSWCTLHARNAAEMLARMKSLCEQVGLTAEASGDLVGGALDLIIYIAVSRQRDGTLRRYIKSVREVGGWNGQSVASTEVCGPGPDGLAVPKLQFGTLAGEKLAEVGYQHRIVR